MNYKKKEKTTHIRVYVSRKKELKKEAVEKEVFFADLIEYSFDKDKEFNEDFVDWVKDKILNTKLNKMENENLISKITTERFLKIWGQLTEKQKSKIRKVFV